MPIYLTTSARNEEKIVEVIVILSHNFHGLFSFHKWSNGYYAIALQNDNLSIDFDQKRKDITGFQKELNELLKEITDVVITKVETEAYLVGIESTVVNIPWRTILQLEYDNKLTDPERLVKILRENALFSSRTIYLHTRFKHPTCEIRIPGIGINKPSEIVMFFKNMPIKFSKEEGCRLLNIICDNDDIRSSAHLGFLKQAPYDQIITLYPDPLKNKLFCSEYSAQWYSDRHKYSRHLSYRLSRGIILSHEKISKILHEEKNKVRTTEIKPVEHKKEISLSENPVLFSKEKQTAIRLTKQGIAHFGAKKYTEAVTNFKTAIDLLANLEKISKEKIQKLHAMAHYHLALAYCELNQIDLAKAHLEKCIAIGEGAIGPIKKAKDKLKSLIVIPKLELSACAHKDKEQKTSKNILSGSLASSSHDLIETKSIKSTAKSIIPEDTLLHTFSFLDPGTISRIGSVNKEWKKASLDSKLWNKLIPGGGKPALLSLLKRFPSCLHPIILNELTPEKINRLIIVLSLNTQEERTINLFGESALKKTPTPLLGDNNVLSFILGIINLEQLVELQQELLPTLILALAKKTLMLNEIIEVERRYRMYHLIFRNEYGLLALQEKLISIDQLALFFPGGQFELNCLLTSNGIKALKAGLIAPEQAQKIGLTKLRIILSDIGIKVLEEKLITANQVVLFSSFYEGEKVLNCLLTPDGIKALKANLITLEQASMISVRRPVDPFTLPDLDILLSNTGVQALEEKLITLEQAKLFSSASLPGKPSLHDLLTPNGLKALKARLITPEQACKMSAWILRHLLSDVGVRALEEKLITAEQVRLFPRSPHAPEEAMFSDLLAPNGIKALKAKLITPEQGSKMSKEILRVLMSDIGIQALEEKLITVDQITSLYDTVSHSFRSDSINSLKCLLSPHGIKALRSGFITPEQASKMSFKTLSTVLNNAAARPNVETIKNAEEDILDSKMSLRM